MPQPSGSKLPDGVGTPEARPWQASAVDPIDRRRRELFRLAADVFRDHGYRGATIKALAHACHLAPAGLYHYFTSKADLATYIVRQPRMDWPSVYVDPDREPIVQLSEFLDLAIRELPDFLLALSLAEELNLPGVNHIRRGMFTQGETIFGRYIAAVRPGLSPDVAREHARLVLALLVGSHEIGRGGSFEADVVRGRIVRLLRAELVPVAIDSAHFDRVMAGS
jgi:AcrR family transcriptional regulator